MSVDKVILRAFLSTLAAIAILIAFMFTMLICIYPQTMMQFTYDLGMEDASIHFAEQSYKRTDEVYYIAYATEVAILDENDGKIASCGQKFIADDNFDAYCQDKDASVSAEVKISYKQYVYGQVCVAMFERGQKTEAVTLAFEGLNGEFPENNAVVALLLTAIRAQDIQTKDLIREKLNEVQANIPDTDKAYFGKVFNELLKE